MYKVYVIYSNMAGKYYTGQTEDLERRLKEHNEGTLGKFTKNKGPWELVYFEEFKTREEALKREKYLKTGAGRDFVQLKLKK